MGWFPSLLDQRILDVGSSTGKTLTQIAEVGGDAVGIEPFQEFIDQAHERAHSLGVSIQVVRGTGENLPFPDNSFGFVNISEVIEHVENPVAVLREIHRVLKPGGAVYMSAPNRFGFYDPHYHAYFVNWLPRFLAHSFLNLIGKGKSAALDEIGKQRLDEMHYYTFGSIRNLCISLGFKVADISERKTGRLWWLYRLLRPVYVNDFHLALFKPPVEIGV